MVDNAEGADARAVRGAQGNACVEAHVRIADDRGVFGEAIVAISCCQSIFAIRRRQSRMISTFDASCSAYDIC